MTDTTGEGGPWLTELDALADGGEAMVSACPSRKAREMGLTPGVQVRMMRNRRREHAVVVAVEDARFMVARAVARTILVAVGTQARVASHATG